MKIVIRPTWSVAWGVAAGIVLWLGMFLVSHAEGTLSPVAPTYTGPSLINPACASWGADRVDCFIVGNDGRMYHTWSDVGSSGDARDFAPWFAEPGAPRAGFDPSVGLGVTAWAPGRLDIMAITQDGSVAHRYYDGSAWRPTDWENLGRPAAAKVRGIGCASWGVNRIDCFTRGLDRRVYQVRWDGVSWGWFDMGPLPTGTLRDNSFSGVGAAAYASNSLFQLVISWDGDVYHRKWNGAAWSGWVNSGKPPTNTNLISVSCQAGIIYVMDCAFLDFSGRAWHRSYYESQSRWLDWHNLGPTGVRASNAGGIGYAKVTGDNGAMYVMVYGMDGVVYLGFGRGSTSTFDWYGWSSLGRPKDQHLFLPLVGR
jgi:hypothetical protein